MQRRLVAGPVAGPQDGVAAREVVQRAHHGLVRRRETGGDRRRGEGGAPFVPRLVQDRDRSGERAGTLSPCCRLPPTQPRAGG